MSKKKKVANLSQRLKQLEEQLARALADYDNLQKRLLAEKSRFQEEAAARVLDKVLDVYDDLQRAAAHLEDRGVKLLTKKFWAVLESEGVAEIKTKGAEFDPQLMDCVAVVAGPKNKVVETVIPGYTLKGKVLRPAKVKVGKGGSHEQSHRH